MDQAHKEILITNRAELVENLNMRDGLFTQLIARKILNQRMVRTIQHNKTPDQQSEALLDILPSRGPTAFQAFCEALQADFQEEVVRLYLTAKPEESPALQTTPSTSSAVAVQEERTPPVKETDSADSLPSLKRPRPASPQTICIRGEDDRVILKCLPQPLPPRSIRVPVMEQGVCGEEVFQYRHLMKHYISEQGDRFVPEMLAGKNAAEREVFLNAGVYYAPAHVQYAHLSPPSKLSKHDSIDTMPRRPGENSADSIVSVHPRSTPSAPHHINWDDANIDLTDGPVIVNVEHSTRQFYLANCKKAYEMRRIPRGYALIVNVNEVDGKPPRRGSNIDCCNLDNLLKQLQFVTHVYNDEHVLTATGIVEKLQKFAELPEHKESDCAVICLLSHGEEGYIFGTDGKKIALEEIFLLFDNNNCKNLMGKPKIFVIQACRGGALDKGVKIDETDGDPVSSQNNKMPTMSDMLVCYPTQMGYYAWRNRERGSWYIEAIVQIFMRHAKNEDICAMLNRVNQLVSRKMSSCPQADMDKMCQMSEYKSTLRKPYLYFFPGIGFPNTSSSSSGSI